MDKARAVTDEGYRVKLTTERHEWVGDARVDAGGTDQGPNPEEILLGALGSCTVMTLHMYADRKKWDLQKVEIDLELEKVKAADYDGYEGDSPFVNVLRQNLTFHGDLDESQRARLMEIAEKCPVHRVIQGPAVFEDTEVLPDVRPM